ncbi:MAG TPA: sialidase family protein [Candidatus Limnocylindrales bacterium]|nr:sialidase family protein [Candidatus Limnocylindrales bacterium]
MGDKAKRRAGRSAGAAILLSLLLAGQAMGAGWSAPTALTTSGKGYGHALVTLGTSTAVAVYVNNGRIVVRRSTNSGSTWSSPVRLAEGGDSPAAAGRGGAVDVVWAQNDRIRYARSTNSGASFSAPVELSPSGVLVMDPSVGRGANGLVVVSWLQVKRVPCCDGMWTVMARVSTNGGASFGPARNLGSGWQAVAAAGKGVAYVAIDGFGGSDLGLAIRRSLDGGASWSERGFAWPDGHIVRPRALSITAAGKYAYVAYQHIGPDGSFDSWVGYRRTASKGDRWSAARNLTPPGGPTEADAVISLKGGVLRAAFVRNGHGIWYSQSADGLSWSAAQQAVVDSPPEERPFGVGHAGRPMVGFSLVDYDNAPYPRDVYVALGTP